MYKNTVSVANLQDILRRQPVWRGGAPAAAETRALPTGFALLDRELPGCGWPTGALTEILAAREGVGELRLVLPALAALTRAGKRVAWLAPPHLPYAPALAAAGVRLEHLVVVRAPGRRDALWAAEQVLRAGACHALLAWLPSVRYAELRRLAVAAEASPGFTVLFRPPQAMRESSPSCLRLALETSDGRLVARILKRRGMPFAVPLPIPVGTPVRALDRVPSPAPAARSPAARLRPEPVE
ncbi:MAG: translesion DNA synthesis-associated protein ImuA [Betaproteobacteria bacterium]|nr:MAG: translesion DNA synthesis-associated protein ImuA [Betaproteobacteria bacterium]